MRVEVHVRPNASRPAVGVAVGVPRGSVTPVRGARSRRKLLEIDVGLARWLGWWALSSNVARIAATITAGALSVLSALHLAWGLGASFPFRSRDELADAVVGTSVVPPPIACFAVAGALATGAALAANVAPVAPGVRQRALRLMAGVFGLRGALGMMGKTDVVSPGSNSERFLHLDRRLYAPLCLALSLGTLAASRTVAEAWRRP
jgi:hypothetical protein